MSIEASQMLPHVEAQPVAIRWFSALGAVQRLRDHVEVFVGGSLIASFDEHDRATRNATVVGLAADPHVHLGQLADAFDISIETLRLLRRQHAAEGIEAVMQRAPGGRSSKVTGPLRRRIEELFESGLSISKVHGRVRRGRKIGRTSIVRARKVWTAKSAAAPAATSPAVEQQSSLKIASQSPSPRPPVPVSNTTPAELVPIAPAQPESAAFVQHAGTWLMSAMLGSFGLYDRAQVLACDNAVDAQSLRLALDAVVSALAIGESCVEGVRRIETPSAPLLLRCHHAPSASWVRRVLHEFADTGSAVRLHLGMAGHWIREAHAQDEQPVVFYVDNHYAGMSVMRGVQREADDLRHDRSLVSR